MLCRVSLSILFKYIMSMTRNYRLNHLKYLCFIKLVTVTSHFGKIIFVEYGFNLKKYQFIQHNSSLILGKPLYLKIIITFH